MFSIAGRKRFNIALQRMAGGGDLPDWLWHVLFLTFGGMPVGNVVAENNVKVGKWVFHKNQARLCTLTLLFRSCIPKYLVPIDLYDRLII
jgi:hypothetical protein